MTQYGLQIMELLNAGRLPWMVIYACGSRVCMRTPECTRACPDNMFQPTCQLLCYPSMVQFQMARAGFALIQQHPFGRVPMEFKPRSADGACMRGEHSEASRGELT